MKLTTEQLLKLAQSHKDELTKVGPKKGSDVLRFINEWDIKEGKNRVSTSLIYQAYKAWSLRPKNRRSFLILFSQAFPSYPYGQKRVYLLNYRAVELLNKIDNKKIKI